MRSFFGGKLHGQVFEKETDIMETNAERRERERERKREHRRRISKFNVKGSDRRMSVVLTDRVFCHFNRLGAALVLGTGDSTSVLERAVS